MRSLRKRPEARNRKGIDFRVSAADNKVIKDIYFTVNNLWLLSHVKHALLCSVCLRVFIAVSEFRYPEYRQNSFTLCHSALHDKLPW